MNCGVTQNPVISVIVPVYRVRDCIEACLQSLLSQVEPPPYELILVDDCGGDDSVELALQFLSTADDTPPCRLFRHERNRGLSAARNTGFESAVGQYVFFLDSDDMLLPHALHQLWLSAVESRADVIIGGVDLITPSDDMTRYFQLPVYGVVDGKVFLETYSTGRIYAPAWNKLIRRSFLTEHHLMFAEGLIHEDELWSMQLAFCRPTACLLRVSTYLYRNVREGSIMGRITPLHLASKVRILSLISQLPDKHQLNPGPGFMENFSSKISQWLWYEVRMAYRQGVSLRAFADELARSVTPAIRRWYTQSGNTRLRRMGYLLRLWPVGLRRWLLYCYLLRVMSKES